VTNALSPHLSAFAINDWMFERALTTIPESAGDRRLDPSTNPARAIALHLLAARHSLCSLLGAPPAPLPWSKEQMGEGTQAGYQPSGPKPSLGELVTLWRRLSPHFHATLGGASASTLGAPSPMPIPGVANATVGDFAKLNVVHECYHLGQIGMLTKAITGKRVLQPDAPGA